MNIKLTTRTLKTTLSMLCTASFLSGCLATQQVKLDDGPNKPSRERLTNAEQPLLTNGEPVPSRLPIQPVTQHRPREKPQSNTQRQSLEQLQLMYINYLKREGYLPKIDSDGDIIFKKEGRVYFIAVRAQQKDPNYFRIVRPFFWSIDNETERQAVLAAADHVNSTIKVVKVYTVKDDAWASVEIFVSNREYFKDIFPRLMSVLSGGVRAFAKKMKEVRRTDIRT